MACIDDESGFSYDEASGIGPSRWGELRPEWGNCSSRDTQSPIAIVDNEVRVTPLLGPLLTTYRASEAVLRNRGHDLMVMSSFSIVKGLLLYPA